MSGAEFAQVGISRYNNFFIRPAPAARRLRNDTPNELAIGRFIGDRKAGIKPRVLEKFFGRTRDHETVMGVRRRRFATRMTRVAGGRIEMVFPHQLIRITERVLLK
jgi:hypothetical protein